MNEIILRDDMGGSYCLKIAIEDDGDVIVSMMPDNESCLRFPLNETSMQFCTLQGGSRKPHIAKKFREIVELENKKGGN